jgi:hypothetical protein
MQIKGNGINNICHVIGTLKITIIIIIATKANSKLTNDDITLETGKIYFGTYIFLKKLAFPKIEFIAVVVDSEKKVKMICPDKIYIG